MHVKYQALHKTKGIKTKAVNFSVQLSLPSINSSTPAVVLQPRWTAVTSGAAIFRADIAKLPRGIKVQKLSLVDGIERVTTTQSIHICENNLTCYLKGFIL
jgi:hypothetical protein